MSAQNMTFDERFSALDDEKAKFVSKVYGGLTLCLGISAAVAMATAHFVSVMPGTIMPIWSIVRWVPLVMLLGAMFIRLSGPLGWVFLFAFVAVQGFAIGPIIAYYAAKGGIAMVGTALGITAGVFLTLTAYVRWSGKNFSWLGGFLWVGTIILLLASLASWFFGFGVNLQLILSVGGALLFSGWILYDTSAVTREYYHENNVPGAILMLYVDIINLFLYILQILNILGSSDD